MHHTLENNDDVFSNVLKIYNVKLFHSLNKLMKYVTVVISIHNERNGDRGQLRNVPKVIQSIGRLRVCHLASDSMFLSVIALYRAI